MTADQLEKIMANIIREQGDRRVCVFVPGIGDIEIRGVTTMGQITTVPPPDGELRKLHDLLKAVQSDRGNWLHAELEKRIEEVVGPAGPWRELDDPGWPATPLERAFAGSPGQAVVEEALKKIGSEDDS